MATGLYIGEVPINGVRIGVFSEHGIIPEGNITLNENGVYNVTEYAQATVSIVEDIYGGSYTVTPNFTTQTLSTNNKKMINNVTINPIPVTKENNAAGGYTLTVGG